MWCAPGIQHALFDGPRPSVKLETDSPPADSDLVRQIADIYQEHSKTCDQTFPTWASISQLKQRLDDQDVDALIDLFGNLFQGDLLGGMGQPRSYYDGKRAWRPGFKEL